MTKSLYAVLNVSPDADPAVIEAAYKALIKKYHPDVRTEEPETALRRAAEINEAFQVLKDPERRAQYDTDERARRDAIRRAATAMAEGKRPYVPPPPPPRRRSKWSALFMIAIMGVAVYFIWKGSEAARGGEAAFPDLPFLESRNEPEKLAPVRQDDIQRAVAQFTKISDRSGLLGLAAYSQDCFAEQGRSPKTVDFDYCVAFDRAALTYSGDIPGHDYLPQLPRFEPREVGRRHVAAGKLISSDESAIEARIAQVGILTSERLRSLAADASTAVEPAPAAALQAARATRPVRTARNRQSPRPRSAPRPSRSRSDPDFLEREGYIY